MESTGQACCKSIATQRGEEAEGEGEGEDIVMTNLRLPGDFVNLQKNLL